MCLGIPAQVVEVGDAAAQTAVVNMGGARRTVSTALLAEASVQPDGWVLVHAGFALNILDEHEARELLAVMREMSELNEAFSGDAPEADVIRVQHTS